MSHPTDLNHAQRVLARHLQEVAGGQGMTPGAMLAMLRDTVGGPADLNARYGLDDAELDQLAAALVRADGFDLLDPPPAAPFDARGFRTVPETLAQRRDRLTAELAELDRQIAIQQGRHPDVVGVADPVEVKAISDKVDANEEIEHSRIVADRLKRNDLSGGE